MDKEFLILAIPVALLMIAGTAFALEKPNLSLERTISETRVAQGVFVDVHLTVQNRGNALDQVWIEDPLPQGVQLAKGSNRALASLKPGAEVRLEYTIRPRRGVYHLRDVEVEATDLLGLTRKTMVLSSEQDLWVLPEVYKLPSLHIQPRQTIGMSGLIPARQGGPGVSFFGVREYQPGDDLRWVNWRASQRHLGVIYANEYEQERAANVGIILDARQTSHFAVNGETLFEYSVVAAASLAQVFLEMGNQVGLMVYGRFIDWTFPGYGKRQRERILQSLARARVGESEVLNNLRYLPTRAFSPKSQVIFVSPIAKEDVEYLIWLRARGYSVLVICPDPVTLELRKLPKTENVKIAGRIVKMERQILFRQLKQAGIQVLDWDVSIPFDQAIQAYGRRMRYPTGGRL